VAGFNGIRGPSGDLPLNADINVTSLVDVAFVLLIIFMITAPMMQGGVEVQLPRAEARPIQPKQGLVISVTQDGRIYVDDSPLTYEEFKTAFPTMVSARHPNGVFVRGDKHAQYGLVVQVLGIIRAAGIQDVGLIAESEEPGK
jgi:biopolymer transport protein ExbD/biopolymer transport protein TolR